MQRALMFSVTIAALSWATIAVADPSNLKGEYGFTGSIACFNAAGGFNANLTPKSGAVSYQSASTEGIYTLDGNGNGTVKSTTVSVNPTGTGNVLVIKNAYSITYTVNADGSWSTDLVPESFTATFVAGTRAGQTSTLDKLSQVGLIGEDAKTLMLASVDAVVETQIFSNGDVLPRICHRSNVLVSMPHSHDQSGDSQ